MSNNSFADLVSIFEKRVDKELARILAIDPNADPKKAIDLVIRQQTEKFAAKLEQIRESEESGKDDEIEILRLRAIIETMLPEVARILKKRY